MEFGNADYYIIGELVACWGSFLICINIFLSFSLYDKRQRLFLCAAGSTLCAAVFNIASVYCIASFHVVPLWLNEFVTTMYFLLLLITPYAMSVYVFDIAFSDSKKRTLFTSIGGVIQLIYMLIVLLNIKTGWVFSFDPVPLRFHILRTRMEAVCRDKVRVKQFLFLKLSYLHVYPL